MAPQRNIFYFTGVSVVVHPQNVPSNRKNTSVLSECFNFTGWRAASLESAAKNQTGASGELNK